MTTLKIAIKNLKHNKSRSILIGIAIMLTTCLLMILGSSAVGFVKYNKANIQTRASNYHGAYRKINKEQLEILNHHAEVIKMGYTEDVASVKLDEVDGVLTFFDEIASEMTHIKLEEGSMPKNENEIVAQKEFLESLDSFPEVGNKLSIPYRIKGEGEILKKEFVISGILPSNEINNLQNKYRAFVSEEFYNSSIKEDDRSYTILFKVAGEDELSYEEIEEKINSLAMDLGVDADDVMLNKMYLIWATDPGTETILVAIFIGSIIVLFSILVIYSIFYIGIIEKIQQYGIFRAIGMTKNQMRRIVLGEGIILASISIIIGTILGYIVTKLGFNFLIFNIVKEVSNVDVVKIGLFNLPVTLIVILTTLLAVYVSLLKPMKMASGVSPIEAIRYQESNNFKKEKRKGYESITLFKLIISNIMRNKKRTITTILTMGLSCVLFVAVANVLSSINIEDLARRSIEKGEFLMQLDYAVNDTTYPENNLNNLQKSNPMGEKLIGEIESIDGVTKVEKRKTILASFNMKNEEERRMSIEALSREDYNARIDECVRGELDYDKSVEENGIVFTYDNAFEDYGFKIGDKLNFTLYDGEKTIRFKATLLASTKSHDTSFIMTEETLEKITGNDNLTSKLYIYSEESKEKEVANSLEDIAGRNTYYHLTKLTDKIEVAKLSVKSTVIPAYGLLGVMVLIGFINLTNTFITNILVRKRELGILQAIGLTNKQLIRMFQAEGLIFTIGTLVIALTLGNGLGYALFLYAKENDIMSVTKYHFPMNEVLILTILLVGMQLFLSYYMTKSIQKDTLIDRIRHQE